MLLSDWLPGDCATASLIRSRDWTDTPLGPIAQWPAALRITVSTVLASRMPMLLAWGPELVQIYNDAYLPIMGGRHPAAMGRPVAESWPEAWHFAGPVFERVLRQGGSEFYEDAQFELVDRGRAATHYISLSYSPVRTEQGAIAGVLVTALETTGRVRDAQARTHRLERSRNRIRELRHLFDQAPGFIAVLRGPDHVFEIVNESFYQLVGHHEILGQPAASVVPADQKEDYRQIMDRVFGTGEPFAGKAMSVVMQPRPGAAPTEAFVDLVYQPIREDDGSIWGIFLQGHDVTELVRTLAALRDSEERQRLIVESSSLGTYDWDARTDVLHWSAATRRMFGVDPDTPISAALAFERMHPDDRARVRDVFARATDPAGPGEYREAFRACWPDGTVRWLDAVGVVKFSADRDGGQQPVRFAGVVWDTTEQQRLLQSLREADARKDEFLAMLAHELRNPLAPMTNALRLTERAGGLNRLHQQALSMIDRQVRQMTRLVDDLLEVNRITRGTIELRCEPMQLAQSVHDAVEAVRPAAEQRGHAIEVVLPQRPVQVVADATRIAQILGNLLNNACRYTPDGGRLRVELREAPDAPDAVELCVDDNGVGIEPAKLEAIFELFAQVEPRVGALQGGLGIGLALVRRLVELHGGTVCAYSQGKGQGARFVVRLPRQAACCAPGPARQEPAQH